MSIKDEAIKNISESVVGCQSRPPKPIITIDTGTPPKLQIPSNLQSNLSSEIGQNDIVVTSCSFQPETIDCHDSKYTIIL